MLTRSIIFEKYVIKIKHKNFQFAWNKKFKYFSVRLSRNGTSIGAIMERKGVSMVDALRVFAISLEHCAHKLRICTLFTFQPLALFVDTCIHIQ